MPRPTAGDQHVNGLLTDLSVGFLQDDARFIAPSVFPMVPVQKQSDRYVVYTRADFYRDEAAIRAPHTQSAGGGYAIDTTPTYFCPKYAYHKDVDDDDRANADQPLRPDEDAMAFTALKMKIRRERAFATNAFGTSIWNTDQTGVASAPSTNQFLQWDVVGSTPIEDVETQKEAIDKTGFPANTIVYGRQVWTKLKQHAALLERVVYGGTPGSPATITQSALAAILELDRVIVAGGVYNSANQGATEVLSYIFGKAALLLHVAQRPGLWTPSAGYGFSWTGLLGSNAMGARTKKFRMEAENSDRIEMEMAFDFKVIAPELGRYFTAAIG